MTASDSGRVRGSGGNCLYVIIEKTYTWNWINDDEEDEVARIISWAVDAARLCILLLRMLFKLDEAMMILRYSNSTLKNHINHPHCEALKRVAESGQSSMSRDGSIFVYNPDVLRE
ncbi:hypothetical protein Tco_1556779 [Tanacetum coccineum]